MRYAITNRPTLTTPKLMYRIRTVSESFKKGSKLRTVHTLDTAIQYMDKEIEKEINRTLKILPEISYVLVGIALLTFIVTILIPCMQIYLGGLLFI